ncbi:radical SAM family heme chaperone HemW [Thermodesulfovibrio yellowstonii]|nr:radical SAM family heme chaperone HemW [Thermodesulfovibrio sp.]
MSSYFSSLYVHVPFCMKKCRYCSFYSVKWSEEVEQVFIKSILREIKLCSELPHLFETVYVGGGTPSSMRPKTLEMLLKSLVTNFRFASGLEFSIEINPATVNLEKMNIMRDFGVNRISIGVQSFKDEELSLLGRMHSSKAAIDTIGLVIRSGFENISIDLMYAIPFQTVESWMNSLKMATSLKISHVSIYELTLEENTLLFKDLYSGKVSLPPEKDIVQMYLSGTEFLESKGLIKYEISNFAKKGFECRHNNNYWQRKPYLGIGPSAHSFNGKERFHNPSDLLKYSAILKYNSLMHIIDYRVDAKESLKEKVFLGLRTTDGVVLDSECLLNFFRVFEEENLVKIVGKRVFLTDKGMMISNELFVEALLHIENCPVCKQE